MFQLDLLSLIPQTFKQTARDVLFEPSLQQEPLALLQELSRNKSLIVAWGGSYDEQNRLLIYAEPGHPEYRCYERPEVIVVAI